jgi:hypothetical protein
MLSNHNQQVWCHPKEKKLLYNVAGTHNLNDVGTDAFLAMGKLKDTSRYKQAGRTLEEAKQIYYQQRYRYRSFTRWGYCSIH